MGSAERADAAQSLGVPVSVISRVSSRFVRFAPDGERFVPHRFRDGFLRMADPALGKVKHHAANQIAVQDDEVAVYLERGFLLRMRGERSKQVNLIAASEIVQETP